jgi:hypothetical protein
MCVLGIVQRLQLTGQPLLLVICEIDYKGFDERLLATPSQSSVSEAARSVANVIYTQMRFDRPAG